MLLIWPDQKTSAINGFVLWHFMAHFLSWNPPLTALWLEEQAKEWPDQACGTHRNPVLPTRTSNASPKSDGQQNEPMCQKAP